MPISQKTVVTLVLLFLGLLLGAAVILDRAVRPGFERLEAQDHNRDLIRVWANLDSLARDVRSRTTDYAYWDDTYAFLGGRNPAYVDDLTDDWFADYGVDLVAFVDVRGRVLWSRIRQADGAITSDTEIAAALAAAAPRNRSEPTIGVARLTTGDFVMLGASTATRSDGGGVDRGVVLMGRRLSAQVLQQQTQLHISIADATAPQPGLAERLATLHPGAPQSWRTNEELDALVPLTDMRGRVVGALHTVQPREISALGATTAGAALLLFAALLSIGLAALWFSLRAAFIQRLLRLEQHLHAQRSDPAPMPVETGRNDEITRLTCAYNALVERLRESGERERAAKLESEMEAAANRMKSDFLANVSHELRTPLNGVIGYAELLHEDLADHGLTRSQEDLDRIVNLSRQLLGLVNEILDLSKLEAGRLDVRPESFAVQEPLQEALLAVSDLAETQRVTLIPTIEGDLGTAYTDQHRLRQCIIHVLSHACKLAPHSSVRLHARRTTDHHGESIRFEITDTGAGMTEAQLKRAFEPFMSSSATSQTDAGLGLAITRKLLALLGGHIDAQSTPGAGTRIAFSVPVVIDDERNAAARTAA